MSLTTINADGAPEEAILPSAASSTVARFVYDEATVFMLIAKGAVVCADRGSGDIMMDHVAARRE